MTLHFLDDDLTVTIDELARHSGLPREAIADLVEQGAIRPPHGSGPATWRFSRRTVSVARRAARLRAGFALDAAELGIALSLLDRIEDLEQRMRELECQLLR